MLPWFKPSQPLFQMGFKAIYCTCCTALRPTTQPYTRRSHEGISLTGKCWASATPPPRSSWMLLSNSLDSAMLGIQYV